MRLLSLFAMIFLGINQIFAADDPDQTGGGEFLDDAADRFARGANHRGEILLGGAGEGEGAVGQFRDVFIPHLQAQPRHPAEYIKSPQRIEAVG